MFAPAIITFRESIEAILVVGIVLTFINKSDQNISNKYVWYGVIFGIFISVLLAYLLFYFFGGLKGKNENFFEGVMMFVTVALITWFTVWIHGQKKGIENIKHKVEKHLKNSYGLGISILIAVSIIREGAETALYLNASNISGLPNQLTGAVIGILTALIFGFLIFRFAIRVNMRMVFDITSIFLILFAAGLLTRGIHEFQEVGVLPVFSFDPVLNLSNFLSRESLVGDLLKTLFGYSDKPTFLELIAYAGYLAVNILLLKITFKKIHN